MRLTTLIARTGTPIPPPSGPARTRHCLAEGAACLRAAGVGRFDAELSVAVLLRGARLGRPPSPLGLDAPAEGGLVNDAGRDRVRTWFALARGLRRRSAGIGGSWPTGRAWLEQDFAAAEAAARRALGQAVDAYNWLDDAWQDLGDEPLIATGPAGDAVPVGELVRRSHALAHALGDLVGGLFGCELSYRDGAWYDACPVDLLHLRQGASPGFTARHLCSVCEQDLSQCPHSRGKAYTTRVLLDDDDVCSACDRAGCGHAPGEPARVICGSLLADIDLVEVSLVPRPRDPLARITSREVDAEELAGMLGRAPRPGERVLDHSCMHHCSGMRRPQL